MKKQSLLFHVLFVAFFLSSATRAYAQFNNADADADAEYATTLLKPGTAMPPFKTKTLDGKTFKSTQLKGKYVVLDFWASWCPDCRKDIPNLLRIYDCFHGAGVEFVGISLDTDRDAWSKAVSQYGIPYLQVGDLQKKDESALARLFGVKWIPSLYLINPKGQVVIATVLSDKIERYLYEVIDSTVNPDKK